MNQQTIFNVLVMYLCFIPLLTFHEFGHAWMAWKCGDDTARRQGRVSLNPIVHMEWIGTVVLPLLGLFLGAAGNGLASFVIGWGKPVPVNLSNLRRPRIDDTLIALAGPAMNILLAVAGVALIKVLRLSGVQEGEDLLVRAIYLSLGLCFFNLLPIPPLDGSHVLKNLIGMSYETYWKLCRFGFIMVIIAMQFPFVRKVVWMGMQVTLAAITALFRI